MGLYSKGLRPPKYPQAFPSFRDRGSFGRPNRVGRIIKYKGMSWLPDGSCLPAWYAIATQTPPHLLTSQISIQQTPLLRFLFTDLLLELEKRQVQNHHMWRKPMINRHNLSLVPTFSPSSRRVSASLEPYQISRCYIHSPLPRSSM